MMQDEKLSNDTQSWLQ